MLLVSVPAALACGGFFAPPEGFAVSDTQEAIYTPGADTTRVDYRVLYQGDTQTFGWVLPIPGTFVSLADGDEADFTAVRNATAPKQDFAEVEEGGCGPRSKGGDFAGGLGDSADTGGVSVVATGYTGTYTYQVVEATSADALRTWLTDNGFDMGPSGPAVDAYVADGGWQFVAIALAGEPEAGGYDTAGRVQYVLPPVSITYAGTDLTYPARMVRYSTATQLHSIVYVKGDERAHVSGWGEDPIDVVRDEGEIPSYVTSDMWPERLRQAGEATKYGLVFAGEVDGGWVTRFETVHPPSAATVDATFTLDGGTEPFQTVLTNKGEGSAGCGAEAGIFVLVPGLGWSLRRRRA